MIGGAKVWFSYPVESGRLSCLFSLLYTKRNKNHYSYITFYLGVWKIFYRKSQTKEMGKDNVVSIRLKRKNTAFSQSFIISSSYLWKKVNKFLLSLKLERHCDPVGVVFSAKRRVALRPGPWSDLVNVKITPYTVVREIVEFLVLRDEEGEWIIIDRMHLESSNTLDGMERAGGSRPNKETQLFRNTYIHTCRHQGVGKKYRNTGTLFVVMGSPLSGYTERLDLINFYTLE